MPRNSPFWDRMRAFAAKMPRLPSDTVDRRLLSAALERKTETDLALRLRLKALNRRLNPFKITRFEGGSGFPIANTLRHFFLEYVDRLVRVGADSFPTSFNVVESFLVFSDHFVAFDLREEREHLLQLDEYVDWYTSGSFPDMPKVLTDILPEGIVHAYNMVSPLENYVVETDTSTIPILGIALVRHGAEVSTMLLGGEFPPFSSEEDASRQSSYNDPNGREGISPNPAYDVKDRYLPELPNHVRVVVLGRFDLEAAKFDVRYVNIDMGPSYQVLTDDLTIYPEKTERSEIDEISRLVRDQLRRYSGLFSFLATMLYLPAFFADNTARVVNTTFATKLREEGASKKVRDAVAVLGRSQVPLFRTIRCLVAANLNSRTDKRTIEPPKMEFQSSGYWKALDPGQIGETQDGTPIVGKTWVERTDSWSAHSLDLFVISKRAREPEGADPGVIYVMRSGSHYVDLYKIGLTRRNTERRATELSAATGVPTEFETLAQWEVGNCAEVESTIHKRLAHMRVNKRREFFRGSLQSIIGIIEEVLRRPVAGTDA